MALTRHLICASYGRIAGTLLAGLIVLGPASVHAHTPSETYLTLTLAGTNLTGQWDVALRDLQQGLGLDPEAVKTVAVVELARRQEALALDTVARLELKADNERLELTVTDYLGVTLNSGEYARVQFASAVTKGPPEVLDLDARALFGIDVAMHGLLRIDHEGRTAIAAFNAENPAHQFKLGEAAGHWRRWTTFVWEGVWHIWIGLDHLLFLIALLLPAVLRQETVGREGVERFRTAFVSVVKIVTAFTVAHSITLTLAALNLVQLPARLVESVIAASVALAASNNLWPWFRGRGWTVAFGFGLIHGFSFANVLGDLGVTRSSVALPLIGFNIGVELGQLAIVAVFLPWAFGLRHSWFYQTLTFKYGSAAVMLIATAWLFERMFGRAVMAL